MTGPTHRRFSVGFAYIAVILIYIFNATEVNYYLALLIILMTAKAGAIFPDLDHDWHNVGIKTVPNWIINKIIHITGGKHRSWQTHSIDICAIFTVVSYFLPRVLFNLGKISAINKEMLIIILIGFASGWISHLFADSLNGTGVRLFCFVKKTVKIVPKKIGKLRFNTGGDWENFVCGIVKVVNIILCIICLIYPIALDKVIALLK